MKSTKSIENGIEIWRLPNGTYHREDGPAVIHPSGRQEWYINGKHHRIDGPARILEDGTQQWWVNDRNITTIEIESWIQTQNVTWPWDAETQAQFLLSFC